MWLGNGGTPLAALAPRRAETALALTISKNGGRQTMSDDIDFHLGKRMRRRRRLLGLTQQQLAESCGVRFQQIQKYECGANRVSAARLWRIASALEVPVNYFFEGLSDSAVVVPGPTRDESGGPDEHLSPARRALSDRASACCDLAGSLNRPAADPPEPPSAGDRASAMGAGMLPIRRASPTSTPLSHRTEPRHRRRDPAGSAATMAWTTSPPRARSTRSPRPIAAPNPPSAS